MAYIEGQMISGDFDEEINTFSLKSIKNFQTATSLKENQLKDIYHYLKQHEHEKDGQIISFYDQMLVPLSQEEVKVLLDDIMRVQLLYR
ncbi:hypothetical protein HPB58_09925 [Priestia filamentosa]|uniref:hypothetical protein n=1 Tax=Priestia TaxID=2800373 RepID=UPI001FB3646A|nr:MULTISPECIES: hypothetical protein [Priestia]MCY8235529.1 hypothetical protein [Priestia endophytica]UOE62464.1 hypothetical protein HPB58_09925 [Priestia filamentosa]